MEVGADMIVGSLIKNLGGGLAPIGGYIVGKKECVENAAYRLTSPGLGKEVGASLGVIPVLSIRDCFRHRQLQSGALKGAIFAANIYEKLGFAGCTEQHRDPATISFRQLPLDSPEGLIAFCQGNSGSSAGGQLCNTGAMGICRAMTVRSSWQQALLYRVLPLN